MSTDDDWGYAIHVGADGVEHRTPLVTPGFDIPEEEREYIDTGRRGITLWTRKS